MVDEIRKVITRMRERERRFWHSAKAKPAGAFAIAMMLDGFATDLSIAIGDYPKPRGAAWRKSEGLKQRRENMP